MKIKSRFVAAIVTFSLALMMPLSFTSCSQEDKPEVENPNVPEGPETPDKPENPEPEPKPETYCYKLLTETRADWEGDWIIAYVDGNEIFALHSGDADRGMGYAKKINGYTRGHMLGSSDRTCSPATNRQVFYYSNIAPQLGGNFNTGGGAWNNLEDHIDRFLCADTLYSVVGCYFEDYTDNYGETDRAKKIAGNTSYPTMFYYVLLRTRKGNTGKAVTSCQSSDLQCVAFVMRHSMEKGHRPQAKDMMSVSDLEKITGFKYFVNVPNAPKDKFTASDWL